MHKTEAAREVDDLYQFLRWRYADLPVLIGPDGPFPVAILELSPTVVEDPELITGRRVEPKPPLLIKPQVVEAITERRSEIWNGNTFSLSTVHLDGHDLVRTLNAYLGSYFDMVSSAGYLECELLASALAGSFRARERENVLAQFPSSRECLMSGGGVDAAIGMSALVVYARGDRYYMFCEVRSGLVAEYGHLYHVAPSFIFQPVVAPTPENLEVEFSVEHNIFREYLEELFNVQEVAVSGGAVAPNYFYGHPNLGYLRKLLMTGGAELSGTCLAFNLLNHRPEVCTLLLIRDPEWYDCQIDHYVAAREGMRHLNLNPEFIGNETKGPTASKARVTTRSLKDSFWGKLL